MTEFVGFALDPIELDTIAARFREEGYDVTDFRSPEKLELARLALQAVEAAEALIRYAAEHPGVEPEALAKAELYANQCMRKATEHSC